MSIGIGTTCVAAMVTLVVIVVWGAVVWERKYMVNERLEDREDKIRFYAATVQLLGIVLWPIIWNATVGFRHLNKQPAIIFGLLWPMVVLLVQLQSDQIDVNDDHRPIVPSSYKDTGLILTVVFSLSTLLMSTQGDAHAQNRKKMTHLLMFAIMLSMAFMLPLGNMTGEEHENTTPSMILQASQRVFLNYAIGFVISAITLFLGGGSGQTAT